MMFTARPNKYYIAEDHQISIVQHQKVISVLGCEQLMPRDPREESFAWGGLKEVGERRSTKNNSKVNVALMQVGGAFRVRGLTSSCAVSGGVGLGWRVGRCVCRASMCGRFQI